MTDSWGSRSNSARATVSPPIPESNTPSGALFMERNADADAARKRADFEIGWEVAQVREALCLGAREEMIEDPQHEPVLPFLPLQAQVRGMNRLEVVRFLLCLEGHHGGHAFPGDERRAGHRPVGGRLAPARKQERAQKGAHGPHTMVHRVDGEDDTNRICSSGVLSCKSARRHDGKSERECDCVPTCRRADVHVHRATNTFSLPRSNSTVHSLTPGSRSSPSVWSISGSSGERITSVAVLMSATSRMVTCVPRMTRGIARRKRGNDTRRIKQTSSLPSAGSASGANR